MEVEGVASPEPLIDVDPVLPAPGADEQKPNAEPASDADAQKPEETPEQKEERKESRRASQRARARERHAAELSAAQTEARMLREQLARQQAQPESGEPQRDQYEDYESYLRAVTRYDAEQVASKTLRTEREASQGREQQGKAAVEQAKTAQAWTEREKAFEATTPDYQAIVGEYAAEDLGQLSDVARRAIIDSEVGPQLLNHLARHSDEHDRIAALSPARQAVELGKLEATMSAPVVKQASNAPAPIKPVGQGRSAPNGYSENMTPAEYAEWRKPFARWARR